MSTPIHELFGPYSILFMNFLESTPQFAYLNLAQQLPHLFMDISVLNHFSPIAATCP